jgi:uncharacterized protein (TIGR00251 family)
MGVASPEWLRPSGGRLLVAVKAMPGARTSEIAGLRDGRLLVRVAAQPEKGRANEALVDCLARELGVRKADVELVAGAASRQKTLSIPAACEQALRRLAGVPA